MASSGSAQPSLPPQLLERRVPDPVGLPILVIEVPPLGGVDREALPLHRGPEQLPTPARARGPAGIIRIGAAGELVVGARHLDRAAGPEVVEREVHRAD